MLLRGYDGKPVSLRPSHLTARDIVLSLGFLGTALLGLVFGKLMYA